MSVFLSVFFSGMFLGCNASPLFNHKNADDFNLNVQKSENKVSDCKFSSTKKEDVRCDLFFEKEKLCATLEWKKFQTEEEKGEFYLFFWNPKKASSEGPYINPSDEKLIAVKLWMASMGHGSSPVKVQGCTDTEKNVYDGVYIAKDVYFVMPGKWEIWVQLKKDKEIVEQQKQDFEF